MKHTFSIGFDFDGTVPRAVIEEKLIELVVYYIKEGFFDSNDVRVVDFGLTARPIEPQTTLRATHH
jgi:hypothetical protein